MGGSRSLSKVREMVIEGEGKWFQSLVLVLFIARYLT